MVKTKKKNVCKEQQAKQAAHDNVIITTKINFAK